MSVRPPLRKRSGPGAAVSALRRRRALDPEAGFSLAELSVVMVVLLVLMVMSLQIVDTFTRTTAYVGNTYANVNQVLPVSTNLQRLLRSNVAPAPTPLPTQSVPAPQPSPPFGAYNTDGTPCTSPSNCTNAPSGATPAIVDAVSPYTMSFFTNVGSTAGPALITAACTPNTGQDPATAGCATPTSTFLVTETLPTAGTCPFSTSDTTDKCQYLASNTKVLLSVSDIINADTTPIFSYSFVQTTDVTTISSGSTVVYTTYPSGLTFSSCTGNQTVTTSTTITSSPDANCPAAEVESIGVDLLVQGSANKSPSGSPQEDKTTVYPLSPVSSVYSPTVG